MQALAFWKQIVMDQTDFLERLLRCLNDHQIPYCVIGGQGVNAYAEPVVSLDLDLVVAVEKLDKAKAILSNEFDIQTFPHSLNISAPGSDLRVQVQTDPRYTSFLERASHQEVLGLVLPVAAVSDILQGKLWAVQDAGRRPSKRQKDLADIARLLEAYPDLRSQIPAEILARLVW
jgi:hypothetical protein